MQSPYRKLRIGGVDQRVAAVVSASGWGHGERKFRGQHPTPEAWKKFTDMLAEGKRHKERTGKSNEPRRRSFQ